MLPEYEQNIVTAANNFMVLPEGGKVLFQFPPKIVSDNKGGDWKEKSQMNAEPFAIYYGGKPRTITMEWTYIVTGGDWGIDKISENVKKTRGYFYKMGGDTGGKLSKLVIKFYAYNVVGGGGRPWTFRMDDISVKHSTTMVTEGDKTYPLRTDLTGTFKFFTNMSPAPEGSSGGEGGAVQRLVQDVAGGSKDEGPVDIEGALNLPNEINWY